MSTIPYYTTLPEFQHLALLSATRLNQMLDNLDAVYGLDQRMSIGQAYGCTADNNRSWRGWVAFNGNRLNLALPTPSRDEGTLIVFDNQSRTHRIEETIPHGAPGALKQINLPEDVGYEQFQIYQVYILGDPPTYAYMDDREATTIGAMPAFTNGTASSAADFNAVINATNKLGEQFNQPIIGGARWNTLNWINDNDPYTITTYAQYRHTQFQFYLTAQSSAGPANRPNDHLKWEVRDNTGVPREFWAMDLEHNSSNSPTAPITVRLPDYASLTVGNWYAFRFEHSMHESSDSKGMTRLYWYGQQRSDTAALWTPLNRWSLGDVVDGSGTSNPRLDIMSHNLTYLNGRRNTINPVMRQSTQNREIDNSGHYNVPTFARRAYRWLAYENASTDDEAEAALFYSVGQPNVFASVNLTKTYTTAYLDLDTTPIRPGMIFYAFNCNYAIQVPDHP